MKYKIAAFFANRNGFDALSRAIVWSSLILMILHKLFTEPALDNGSLGAL